MATTSVNWRHPALLLILMLLPSTVPAATQRPVVGWVEKILLEPDGIPLKAKLDTGARTSSLQADRIELFTRDNKKWVRFHMQLEDANGKKHELTVERPRVRRVRIKEHEGEYDRRPVVEMSFCIGNERHSTEFTLVDRSRFIYPVLLGRRFLEGFAAVDASQTFTRKPYCPTSTPLSVPSTNQDQP